jgi:hypothetical protein
VGAVVAHGEGRIGATHAPYLGFFRGIGDARRLPPVQGSPQGDRGKLGVDAALYVASSLRSVSFCASRAWMM